MAREENGPFNRGLERPAGRHDRLNGVEGVRRLVAWRDPASLRRGMTGKTLMYGR